MKIGNFSIKWYYDTVLYPETLTESVSTTCRVFNNNELIAESVVTRYYKDPHCKETARKVSLTRALRNSNLDKAQRAEIWEGYRTKGSVPLWDSVQNLQAA